MHDHRPGGVAGRLCSRRDAAVLLPPKGPGEVPGQRQWLGQWLGLVPGQDEELDDIDNIYDNHDIYISIY